MLTTEVELFKRKSNHYSIPFNFSYQTGFNVQKHKHILKVHEKIGLLK